MSDPILDYNVWFDSSMERRHQKLFTTNPAPPSFSLTISPPQGLRIALRLLWDSIVAQLRGDTVSFTAYEETP